jgi:uncharacterized protein (DUF2461 family)
LAPDAGIPRSRCSRPHSRPDCSRSQTLVCRPRRCQIRPALDLAGDSLTRPPRGYAADHPAIEDLKRKDFIALAALSANEVTGDSLVKLAAQRFAEAAPLMQFLCAAQGVQY